jgi:thioredoxin 1
MADNVATLTDSTFSEEVESSDNLTMVDFWATWCGPCRMVAPVVEELAGEYAGKGLKVGKVDVDENPDTAARFGIRSIPTILFFKNGEVVDRIVGALPKGAFAEKIEQHL